MQECLVANGAGGYQQSGRACVLAAPVGSLIPCGEGGTWLKLVGSDYPTPLALRRKGGLGVTPVGVPINGRNSKGLAM